MSRATGGLLAAITLVLSLAALACGGPSAPDEGSRVPVPLPVEIDQLDQPIQDQLRERHARLVALLRAPEVASERLAAAYGALGKSLHAHDFLASAADAYRQATRLAPASFDWFYYLGRVEQKRGAWPAADAALDRALTLRPHNAPALVAQAQGRLDRHRQEEAEALFRQAAEADPTCATALAGLGQIALDRHDAAAATAVLEPALSLQPNASQLHYQLGRAYLALGQPARANSHFEHVPANNLAQTPIQLTDPLMADLESLRVGARSHDLRGLKALADGRVALAAVEFRQALAADPDRVYAHYGLGLALHRLGRHKEAAEALDALLRVAPNDTPSLLLLGRIDIDRGQTAEAEVHLRAAIRAGEPSGEALRLLDSLRLDEHRVDAAEKRP